MFTLADWNAGLQDIIESRWMSVLGADIRSAEEIAATCNAGAGRHIDCIIASKDASAIFKSRNVIPATERPCRLGSSAQGQPAVPLRLEVA